MQKTVEFIFDFASPNAYFVHKTLQQYLSNKDVVVTYKPALLGGIFKLTGNSAPMIAFANIKGKMDYERLEIQRFIETHKLTKFRMNSHFPVNTLRMMRGAIFAQDREWYLDYVAACFAGMWEEDLLMSDPDVIGSTLTASGLDANGILQANEDQAIKAQLASATEAAVKRGVFGLPTLFVGEQMFFGKERLTQVAEAV
jgi:2-hydroxychromene-2-carboxylate isomerase